MIEAAGYGAIASKIDMPAVLNRIPKVEKLARDKFKNSIQLVKHKRGDFILRLKIFGLAWSFDPVVMMVVWQSICLQIYPAVLATNVRRKQKFELLTVFVFSLITTMAHGIKHKLPLEQDSGSRPIRIDLRSIKSRKITSND